MKISLVQINPTIGAMESNSRKIIEAVKQAGELGANLAITSEMAITGYPPRDLLDRPDFASDCEAALRGMISEVKGIAVLCGHIERVDIRRGKHLANAATLFRDGEVLGRSQKMLLPTYDVFDELRYFSPGERPALCELDGVKIGVTICEDVWSEPGYDNVGSYDRNPVEELVKEGAEMIVNLSASPYHLGQRALRESLGQAIARKHGVPFFLVNQVGGNDDLLFDGHSFAMAKDGAVVARAKGFEEDMVTVDTQSWTGDIREVERSREGKVYRALSMGIRDYLGKCRFTKAVIGLSGGVDSSVVAVLAVNALGPENVTGVSMPSQYTARMSEDDAATLARNLGIEFHTVPIKGLFEMYKKTLKPLFEGREEDVTEENLQARIRGDILMAVSNKFGGMVLSTGNKSETAVGYCTLYGDMAGGLAAISDLPKISVYNLARWINREREIIPSNVLTRPPSAELRPDQTDQDSLPDYDTLDEILEAYVENQESPETIIARGFDKDITMKVTRLVDRNEYKRQQAAPGLKITGKAFGSGRRIPIAQKYA